MPNRSQLPLIMCRDCGHFQEAASVEGAEPLNPDCEECGGSAFVDPADRS